MKKYGVYACSYRNYTESLTRESSSLKDAVKDAYRLARCELHARKAEVEGIIAFSVGNNTGVEIEYDLYYEKCRFIVLHHGRADGIRKSWIVLFANGKLFTIKENI